MIIMQYIIDPLTEFIFINVTNFSTCGFSCSRGELLLVYLTVIISISFFI